MRRRGGRVDGRSGGMVIGNCKLVIGNLGEGGSFFDNDFVRSLNVFTDEGP